MGAIINQWAGRLSHTSPPRWVQLSGGGDNIVYTSPQPSDPNGYFTLYDVPSNKTYVLSTSPSPTGPWTVEDAAYVVNPFASNPPTALAAAVTVPSGGTQITGGLLQVVLQDKGGQVFNWKAYGAKADAQTVSDGVMNGTTAVLTSASGKFVAADAGKVITVAGAGAAGATLGPTTIASVQSATQITLAINSQTAVGAASTNWYTDDSMGVNAAIAAAIAGQIGGMTYGPPGLYSCLNALSVPAGPNAANRLRLAGAAFNSQVSNYGTVLQFNGTGAGFFLNIANNVSSSVENLAIQYTQAGFTGALVGLGGSSQIRFDRVAFNGAFQTTATYLVDIGQATLVSFRECHFSNAQYLVRGNDTAGTYTANLVSFYECNFANAVVASIRNCGQAWDFKNCAFEPLTNGKGGAIVQDGTAIAPQGLLLEGSWFGDTTDNTAWTWVSFGGQGLSMRGCYMKLSTNAGAVGVGFQGTVSGVDLCGNSIFTASSSAASAVYVGVNIASRVWIMGNDFANLTSPIQGTLLSGGYMDGNGNLVIPATSVIAYNLKLTATVAQINNIATQGLGTPAIYRAPAPLTGQTAAVASVTTITSPNDGVKHLYRVSGVIGISVHGTEAINLQASYTDEQGVARTSTLTLTPTSGTDATAANALGPWVASEVIMVNPNTAITILTAGTFTGATYNVAGLIEQLL